MRAPLLLLLVIALLIPPTSLPSSSQIVTHRNSCLLVGCQNGTWFQPGQAPRLYKIFLANDSVTQLTPVPGQGTVWSGGWNGSQWLISGWGSDPGRSGSNPYLYLYDGRKQIVAASLTKYRSESSWHGGDIFAVSYNGKEWLLSGMGSDELHTATYHPFKLENHMSLAMFDGYNFTDLSSIIPRQHDAILYSNAWNSTEWLIGGGYGRDGVLFTFNGTAIVDLTSQIQTAVKSFGSVQCVAWNGRYWLIGGIGFLAKYDGHNITDLTSKLVRTVSRHAKLPVTVNAVAWNGTAWLIGGGSAVAQIKERIADVAWIASYRFDAFIDLSSSLPSYISHPNHGSSILSICHLANSWVFGGFSDDNAILFSITNKTFADLSYLADPSMSYVIWLAADDNVNE